MSKLSLQVRNRKRMKKVAKYRSQRDELKKTVCNARLTLEERQAAMRALANLPRDANPNRVRNRCEITGRPRGVYRKFKLARHVIRGLANFGLVPGLLKASW